MNLKEIKIEHLNYEVDNLIKNYKAIIRNFKYEKDNQSIILASVNIGEINTIEEIIILYYVVKNRKKDQL